MGNVPVAQPSPKGHHVRWSWRLGLAGLGLVALTGLLLAIIALFAWPGGEAPPPPVVAGQADDFSPGSVTTFPEREFHLVRLQEGEFLALHMRDPHGKLMVEEGAATSACLVPFRSEFTIFGRTGWFRNPCHGETYDLTGRCFSGPCPRCLDRFPVRVVDGQVRVDLNTIIPGPPHDPNAEPVTPPQTTTRR